MAEIRCLSRVGPVAVLPVDESDSLVSGRVLFPEGWRAYGLLVPAGEKLHVRLTHPNEGWIRLMMIDRWGDIALGMTQNLIPTGNPEVTFVNLEGRARAVYVIVDDPHWMSVTSDPYALKIDRSWDPGAKRGDETPVSTGIWALTAEAIPPQGSLQAGAAPLLD